MKMWLYHPGKARDGELFDLSPEQIAAMETEGWVDTPAKFGADVAVVNRDARTSLSDILPGDKKALKSYALDVHGINIDKRKTFEDMLQAVRELEEESR